MVLGLLPCAPFVFWPHELYSMGDVFLAYNGTIYAPISGILFVDYFFLRGQKLSLWSIFEDHPSGEYYYHAGYNWFGLGSILLGQACYLFLYNPISGETHALFRLMPPSIAACSLAAAASRSEMLDSVSSGSRNDSASSSRPRPHSIAARVGGTLRSRMSRSTTAGGAGGRTSQRVLGRPPRALSDLSSVST